MVDIVIPTIDDPKYLDRALQSIKDTCQIDQLMIYIINDASKYESVLYENIIEKHRELNIHYQVLSESIGPGPARNTGIKAGFGDWICFLDCDDIYIDDVVKYCDNNYDFFTSEIDNSHGLFKGMTCDNPCTAIHGMGIQRKFLHQYNLFFPNIKYGGEDTMFRTVAMALSNNYKRYYQHSYYQHLARPDSNFLHRKAKTFYLNDELIDTFTSIGGWFSHLLQYLDTLILPDNIIQNKQWNTILLDTTLSFFIYSGNYDILPLEILCLFIIFYKRWINLKFYSNKKSLNNSQKLLLTFIEYFWEIQNDILVFNVKEQRLKYYEFYIMYNNLLPLFIKLYFSITLNRYYNISTLIENYTTVYYKDFYVY